MVLTKRNAASGNEIEYPRRPVSIPLSIPQSRSQRLHSFWSAPRMQDLWETRRPSGIINVKTLANRNLIGYYILPEVYEKEVSKQEIKILRMLLLDVFDHVRDGQWERNLKMGDQTNKESKYSQIQIHVREDAKS